MHAPRSSLAGLLWRTALLLGAASTTLGAQQGVLNAPRPDPVGTPITIARQGGTASAANPRIGVAVGSTLRAVVAPGGKLALPIAIDMSGAGTNNLAALTSGLSWPTGRLTFDSLRTAGFGSLTSNIANVSSGSATFSVFNATGATTNTTLATLYLTATNSTGSGQVAISPTTAGDETGTNILSLLRARGIDVCVATPGKWGDVNGDSVTTPNSDGVVNIIDAQQIARYSVGLTVTNRPGLVARGDVTNDGSVNIIDAQQIARYTVGLSAAARTGTDVFTAPAVSTVTASQASANLNAGESVQLAATPKDAGAVSVAGCVPVTWSTNNAAVATVDSTGLVTAVTGGSATITATAGGQTANVAVTVAGGIVGLHVTVTTPLPVQRYFIMVDSGPVAAGSYIAREVITNARSIAVDIATPAGAGFRVRAMAIDSASSDTLPSGEPMANTSGINRGAVVTTGLTNVALALAAPTYTYTAAPTTVAAGVSGQFGIQIDDPGEWVTMFGSSLSVRVAMSSPWASDEYLPWNQDSLPRWGYGGTTVSNVRRTYNGSLPAPTAAGTITWQPWAYAYTGLQVAANRLFWPRFYVTSIRRGEPLRSTTVTAPLQSIRLTVTSPRKTNRFVAVIDGGGIPSIGVSAPVSSANGTVVTIPVPVGGPYTAHVVATDSSDTGANALYVVAGGRVPNINVGAGALVDVAVPLFNTEYGDSTNMALHLLADSVLVRLSVVDSSGLGTQNNCAFTYWSTATFANDFGVPSKYNGCRSGTSGTPRVIWENRLPPQAAGVTLSYQWYKSLCYANAASAACIRYLTPRRARSEALLTATVVAPVTGVTVNITSATAAGRYFLVVADTGTGPVYTGITTGTNMTSGSVTLPLPARAGTGYRLRIAAIDSIGSVGTIAGNIRAGLTVSNVTVTAGSFTSVPATLVAASNVGTFPGSTFGSLGVPVSAVITDPSNLTNVCSVRWATAALTVFGGSNIGASTSCTGVTNNVRTITSTIAAPAAPATMYVRVFGAASFQLPDGRFLETDVRAATDAQITVQDVSTGARLLVTSPIGANRYLVVVDSGPAAIQGFRIDMGYARGPIMKIPLAAGSGYRIRVIGTDSLDTSGSRASVGAVVSNVTITNGAVADVSLTLQPMTATFAAPTSGVVGIPLPVDVTVNDPSAVFTAQYTVGNGSTSYYCASYYISTGSFVDGSGTGASPCARTLNSAVSARFTGSGPAPLAPGSVNAQARFYASVPLDGVLTQLNFTAPSSFRNQSPIVVPVSSPTTFIRATLTTALPVSRFVVFADSGSGSPIVATLTGTGMTSGVVTLPALPGTTWHVRAVGVDSISSFTNGFNAAVQTFGGSSTFTVVAGTTTDIELSLAAASNGFSVPGSAFTSAPIAYSGSVTDLQGLTPSCNVRWSTGTLTTPSSGTPAGCGLGSVVSGVRTFSGSLNTPAAPGTLSTRAVLSGGYVLPDNRTVELDLMSPIRATTVNAVTTGLTINATSPSATTRFLALIDGGGLAQPIISRFTIPSGTTGQWAIDVPAATGYNVRVFAAHPLSTNPDFSPLVLASSLTANVTVTAGSLTTVNTTLTATTATLTVGSAGTLGTPMPYTFAVVDSSQVLYASSQTTCANVYMSSAAPAFDYNTNIASAFNCTMARPALGQFTWTGNIAPLPDVGTLYLQVGAQRGFSNGTTSVTFNFLTPSLARGEALRAIPFTAGASKVLKVNLSHTGRAARQYGVIVSGNGLTDVVAANITGLSLRSGTIALRVPSAGTYTVRAVALDSAVSYPLFLAGASASVIVGTSDTTTTSMPLSPATYTPIFPAKAIINTVIPVEFEIADPSGLSSAGISYCGSIRYAFTPLTGDFSGNNANLCTVSTPTFGTRHYTGTIPAQSSTGTLNIFMLGVATARIGFGDQSIYFVGPSPTRAEPNITLPVVQVQSVAVSPTNPTVPVGGTQNMTVTVLDPAGAPLTGLPVAWSSSVPGVATVSSSGVVAGVANGTTTISATVGGVTGTTTVTVSGGLNVGSISVSLGAPSLTGNATTIATPVVRDPSGNIISGAVTWSATNRLVARVASDGTVQAIGSGTTDITATIGAVSGSATLTVGATTPQFNIVMRNLTTLSSSVQTAFTNAANRWQQIIRGDVPDAAVAGFDISSCLGQATGTTVLNETIDDVIIYVKVAPIDGVGAVLGSAGPCAVRSGGVTAVGSMTFDSDDLANMEANGTLGSVILHEMGHVLGIGTLWTSKGLLVDAAPSSPDPAGDPIFVGVNGTWGFQTIPINPAYGGRIVPVENCCGSGTRNAHWRESVLQRELMTGFVSSSGQPNPLSPLTAASLIDLGYVVDVSQSDAQPWYIVSGSPGAQVEIREGSVPPPIVIGPDGRPALPPSSQAPLSTPPPPI